MAKGQVAEFVGGSACGQFCQLPPNVDPGHRIRVPFSGDYVLRDDGRLWIRRHYYRAVELPEPTEYMVEQMLRRLDNLL